MTQNRIYLDFNATTPLVDEAKQALINAMEIYGNPSSVHMEGRKAKALLQQARRALADFVSGEADNIVFTSGASEAAMMALTPDYRMGRSSLTMSHLYIGATEHPCISAGGRFDRAHTTIIPVTSNGVIDTNVLGEKLSCHDRGAGLPLVAIQYANHETGVIQPIREIAAMVKMAGGILIVDAVQYLGKERLDISDNCGDFFIVSAHKIGGPKGVGALISTGAVLMPQPLIVGGGQERGLRGGTESLPLISAFGAAARAGSERSAENARLHALQLMLEEGILQIAADAIIYGSKVRRLPNTSFFSVPGIKSETLQIAFDLAGIAVSAGSACSSGKVAASPVLKAMGFEDPNGAIRVSTGWSSRENDILTFLNVLKNIAVKKNTAQGA